MSDGLDLPSEVLHAKHRLLPEIGRDGQIRLNTARFTSNPLDPAEVFATELLCRSGLMIDDGWPSIALPPSENDDPALEAADQAIRAAIFATQRVREIVRLPLAHLKLEPERRGPRAEPETP